MFCVCNRCLFCWFGCLRVCVCRHLLPLSNLPHIFCSEHRTTASRARAHKRARVRPCERPENLRFGFSRDCLVVAGSGDNCNSLAGMGVVAAGGSEGGEGTGGGDVMVSLGTSDTLLGVTVDPSPTTTGGFESSNRGDSLHAGWYYMRTAPPAAVPAVR